jgi:voltage-gated potassium channel
MTHSRTKRNMPLRHWFYVNLHAGAWRKAGLSPMNKVIAALICAAVGVAILQSEKTLVTGHEDLFRRAEIGFAVLFLIEYLCRLWIAVENPANGPGWRGRLRYAMTWPAIIDLIALLSLFVTLVGAEGSILRLFRLMRIIMLAKLGRYSTALTAIAEAVHSRRYELAMSAVIAFMLLLVSSTLLYIVESDGQPESFGSIPRAMWWSIATLTTVGYGDAVPQTLLGRILAGLTAITGIGLIAMPTGILAAAFSDALQRQRDRNAKKDEA